MSFKNWKEVDKELAALTGKATLEQLKLAEYVGLKIPKDLPRIAAGAMLRIALANELDLPSGNQINDRSASRLDLLFRPSDPSISPQTEEEAEAWITYLRFVRRRESLSKLELNEGDVVERKDGEIAEVSSIGWDGRVFFKGGHGFGAWPDMICVVARNNEQSNSASEARRHAENSAARRTASSFWSVAKSKDLSKFRIKDVVSEQDIAELEMAVEGADDERPIQKFLEENCHILTALLGGSECYCIPQKRLGAEYVPDFIIGDVNSLGIRWVLIELETPRSGIYVQDGSRFEAKTLKGINQIIDWRNWLSGNIGYARQRRSENGLGLFDIREKSDAVVVVGRRSRMPETKDALRHEYLQSNGIQIHTYDWLIERIGKAVRFQGPPAINPYILPRSGSEKE